jgi:catechol 2,3-dioxygenase-like lactoylglutathione lyase family enzyme
VATSATDLLIVAFSALAPEEQEEAFTKIAAAHLQRLAGEEDQTAHFLHSLQRVQQVAGGELTPGLYRAARAELRANGQEVVELNALIRYFGTWRQAKEALELSEATTPRKIEARFRSRLVGKVHRYREETLRETLERCAADLGHVPLIIEFEHWRQRELELAKAQGRELFLPSDSPYRRRWGSWEDALLHLGFTPEAIAERLEPGRTQSNESLKDSQFGSSD